MANHSISLNSFFPVHAPKSGDGPTELDRHIMNTFGLSEDEYFKQVDALNAAEAAPLASVHLKSLAPGSSMKIAVNADDERVMKLFGMNEGEWKSAVAAEKAKGQRAERNG